jgi:hypothetical protein
MTESMLVIDSARSFDAVSYAFAQARQSPLRVRDANDRNLECPSFCHRVQCREYHLMREIASHTEEH